MPPSPSPYHHPCYDITISFVIIFCTSPPCSPLSSAMIRCVMLKDKTFANPSKCFAALLARRRSEPALHLRSLKGEALAHIQMCFGATVGPRAPPPRGRTHVHAILPRLRLCCEGCGPREDMPRMGVWGAGAGAPGSGGQGRAKILKGPRP